MTVSTAGRLPIDRHQLRVWEYIYLYLQDKQKYNTLENKWV